MNIPMQISLVSEKTEQAIKFFFSKSYSIIPISLLIILIISGCAKEPTSPTIDETVIMPLKVGNSWTYKYTKFYTTGEEGESSQYTISILYDSVYKGERCYKPYFISSQNDTAPIFYLYRNDGLYLLWIEKAEYILAFKFPVIKGDKYAFGADTIRVESIDTNYTVPAGTFKCIKYVRESYYENKIHDLLISYYCPGIGEIAAENYITDSAYLRPHFKTALLSYELK